MKLSTRARYGLKALIDLGLHSANEAISLQSIAERQDISTSYLEQLMAMLKKAGLVKSSRGAYGGYQLGKPADEISVGEVLRVLGSSSLPWDRERWNLSWQRCLCGETRLEEN